MKNAGIILDSTTERDGERMYFLLKFDISHMNEYIALFESFDPEREYDAKEEIDDMGWVTG